MVHRAVIGDDCRGPVAEASTREQCNALYPGSNPGRASTLRPDGLRVAQPHEDREVGACPAKLERSESVDGPRPRDGPLPSPCRTPKSPLMALFWGFRG